MLHQDGVLADLPCAECPSTLSVHGYEMLILFNRTASVETYKGKDGQEHIHVTMDWPLVSLLLEEDEDRSHTIRALADLRRELCT